MHLCRSSSNLIIQDNNETVPQTCPFCKENSEKTTKQDTKEQSCCTTEQSDCCHDIKLDLKKGDQDNENAPTVYSFFSLSPATITLFWIIGFQRETKSLDTPDSGNNTLLVSTNSPPYLKHCNLRI